MKRTFLVFLAALVCTLGLLSPAEAANPSRRSGPVRDPLPSSGRPTPFDAGAAAAAGRAALSARAAPPPKQAPASGPTLQATAADNPSFRVYTTQYKPLVDGSVEVAVPDKCAKFAALANSGALRQHNCPAAYTLNLDYRVTVTLADGRSATFPVKEVGPWNQDDNYWDGPDSPRPRRRFADLPHGTPEAQSAFYTNYNATPNCTNLDGSPSGRTFGADQFGRCVLNPAGIDLSFEAARQLGLGSENAWVTVSFLWSSSTPRQPPATAVPDLGFAKWVGTGSGRVEVHTTGSGSNYQSWLVHAATPLNADDNKGDFDFADVHGDNVADLVYIKRRDTSGRIEVHAIDGAANFNRFRGQWATALGSNEDANGQFSMADMNNDGKADLIFVKTRNTGTGRVELHWLDAASGFSTFGGHVATGYSVADDGNGTFQAADMNVDGVPDLVFVKDRNTGTGRVEFHWMTNASGYTQFGGNRVSALSSAERGRGRFEAVDMNADARADLVYVKDTDTGTGQVELFWLDANAGFTQFNLSTATVISAGERGNGVITTTPG